MSATIEVPKGLDKLSADEAKLFDQMRSADAGDPSDPQTAIPSQKTLLRQKATPAPAPVEIVQEEPEAEIEEEGDPTVAQGGDGRSRTVPHKAFHAERERRRAAEAKAIEADRKAAEIQARMEERLNLLMAAAQAPAAQRQQIPAAEEPLPDVNVDPIGHFRERSERLAKKVEAIESGYKALQVQQRQAAEDAQLRQRAAAQEQAFAAKEPSYAEAMNFLRESRRGELEALGIHDPVQQQQILGQDIHGIAVRALQSGGDFAQTLFGLAQKRGYKKAVPAAASGVPPLDAATTAVIPDVAATVRAQAGRDNATTIGSAGTAPPARLSLAKIADMNESQFAALVEHTRANGGDVRDFLGY